MKIFLSPLFALVTTALLTWVTLLNPTILQSIDLKISDQLILDEKQSVEDVVLVDISEKTLDVHGQYPLPRNVYGDLILKLRQSNAGVIVFNLSFPEEDRTGQDEEFTFYLNNGVILSHFPTNKSQERSAYKTGIVQVGNDAREFLYSYKGIAANLPKYEERATGIGIANTLPEIDGVVRRLPMISAVEDELYPSIILEIFKAYTQSNTYQIKSNEFGVTAVRVKGFPTIKTDAQSRIWINPNYDFKRYDLVDDMPDLNGATVFVGVTAEGVSNPVPTASGAVYGHDVTARAFTSVLNQYNIVTNPLEEFAKLGTIFIIGLAIIAFSYMKLGWIVSLALIGASQYASFYMFSNYSELLVINVQGLMAILVFAHVYGVKYGQEYFAKLQIKKQFGTYLSPDMVEKLQKNPELLKLGGETKYMTFLFCDIRGFTPISEQYKTNPQGLTELVNRFLSPMTDIIMNNEGTIDKYMGDCIMAFWNAPLDVEEQEKKATKASVEMYEALEDLNAELEAEDLLPINIGVGINTGSVVVGNMGSDQRFDYSVLGDAVNLAARLEGQTKSYGVKTIVGEDTAKELYDDFATLEIDSIAVKGKTDAVTIYTVLGEYSWWNSNSHFEMESQQHDKMLELYRAKQFDHAKVRCEELKGCFLGAMDDYYTIWIDRCDEMAASDLEDDWDGVYRATTK